MGDRVVLYTHILKPLHYLIFETLMATSILSLSCLAFMCKRKCLKISKINNENFGEQ